MLGWEIKEGYESYPVLTQTLNGLGVFGSKDNIEGISSFIGRILIGRAHHLMKKRLSPLPELVWGACRVEGGSFTLQPSQILTTSVRV